MTEMIRVLIADDHAVVREGLRAFIASEPGMTVVGEAADGQEAIDRAGETRPDVLLLDLVMPNKSGLEAIPEIKQKYPKVRILVLTSFTEDDKVFPAIKTGALGYLLKDSSPKELLGAIRDVYNGESSLHPTIARKLIRELSHTSDLPVSKEPLSERELGVVQLVAQGLSNVEIGKKLFISERTVRNHVSSILAKLHLANRTQAAIYALREGLADIDDA
ncbi:MAG: response regulator transcription factor [Anaerolineales bacterium]|nr:response regulator transcription factor [Anaerolineales bacterium]